MSDWIRARHRDLPADLDEHVRGLLEDAAGLLEVGLVGEAIVSLQDVRAILQEHRSDVPASSPRGGSIVGRPPPGGRSSAAPRPGEPDSAGR